MNLKSMYRVPMFVLCLFSYIQNSSSFPNSQIKHNRLCKRIRVQCKIFVKRNYQVIKSDKSKIVQNLKSVITDDLSNDLLYYLKFYHLTNDDEISYFYIIFYKPINNISNNILILIK